VGCTPCECSRSMYVQSKVDRLVSTFMLDAIVLPCIALIESIGPLVNQAEEE